MEENSAALECIIVFYINMKHVLKTRQLVERVFIEEMIKNCRVNGFNYSDDKVKNAWRDLVTTYLELKHKGAAEDKENWKYYEILDSCYETSDFHSGVYPKFSQEMIWFLVECFLKRKTLGKTQRRNTIITEIHKEFVQSGYLYISKQDIENKWKYLNVKYEKLKNDPEGMKKAPYLQALSAFHDGNHIVKMIFTRELTEILIERFTEKKITCVIHGYDSDQVLNEIQAEFKDLGFYFSKDEIKEKWRALTTIYKFLSAKGKSDTTWMYFNAMQNHFHDNFSISWNRRITSRPSDDKRRQLRQRSKSVGAERANKSFETTLKETPPLKKNTRERKKEKTSTSRKKPEKRSTEENKAASSKKLKIRDKELTNRVMENVSIEPGKSKKRLSMSKSIDRNNCDLSSPTSKVHIINIDHSDIDRKSGNLTINLPSITKQFSDNEFLPLKKRLRIDEDKATKEIENGFLGFSHQEITDPQKHVFDASQNKKLTEAEMSTIMERIGKENQTIDRSKNELSYYKPEEFNNYQNMYNNFNQQCLIVPKEERQDLSMQSYTSPSSMTQPPVLLLVIKVDGNNPIKDSAPLTEASTKTEEAVSEIPNNVKETENVPSTTYQTPVETNCSEVTSLSNNAVDTTNSHLTECNVEVVPEVNEVTIESGDHVEHSEVCVGENVTVYTSSEALPEQSKTTETQTTEEFVFRAPLPAAGTNSVVESASTSPTTNREGKIRLPVKSGGKLKEIFISPGEFTKISNLKPGNLKMGTSVNNVVFKQTSRGLKFMSQIITPPRKVKTDDITNHPVDENVTAQTAKSVFQGISNFMSSKTVKGGEEFENESVISEAVGEDDVLKDNLLATVIDFQEQNNQEFIEIKNLMKQNNLLQRETNRLLRLLLEKQ